MVEKGLKKGLKYHIRNPDLTTTEKEILHLLTEEFLTIKQITQRRQTSPQAVYKIIQKLKQKGALNMGLQKVENFQPTPNKNNLRLHAQEFNIRIIWQDNRYQEKLEKSNILFIDGNTIRLYKNSIEIYSGQSFFGLTTNEVEKRSLEYWQRFLTRLEHDLQIGLLKRRTRNIKIVNQHWARGDSEISKNARENRDRVWIYAEEDGKLAFITDNSFGFDEDETLHPITAKTDRKAIDKQVNDWRLNNPPTQTEIAKNQAEIGQGLKKIGIVVYENAQAISGLVQTQVMMDNNIKTHMKVLKDIGNSILELKDVIKELTNGNSHKER